MLVKILIIITMLFILYALGSGMYFLISDKGRGKRTVRALTWRIVISLALFLFLFLSFALGWLNPHGI